VVIIFTVLFTFLADLLLVWRLWCRGSIEACGSILSFPEPNKIRLGQEKCFGIFLWSRKRKAPGNPKKKVAGLKSRGFGFSGLQKASGPSSNVAKSLFFAGFLSESLGSRPLILGVK